MFVYSILVTKLSIFNIPQLPLSNTAIFAKLLQKCCSVLNKPKALRKKYWPGITPWKVQNKNLNQKPSRQEGFRPVVSIELHPRNYQFSMQCVIQNVHRLGCASEYRFLRGSWFHTWACLFPAVPFVLFTVRESPGYGCSLCWCYRFVTSHFSNYVILCLLYLSLVAVFRRILINHILFYTTYVSAIREYLHTLRVEKYTYHS